MIDPHDRRIPIDSPQVYTHSRSRTTSSNIFPGPTVVESPVPMHQASLPGQQAQLAGLSHSRRSPSVNTFSTVSSGPPVAPPAAYRISPTNDLRRSTSSRSGSGAASGLVPKGQSSYVALLRKQKATVWCERAQNEDPHLVAAQRAAKQRATLAIIGSAGSGSPLMGGGPGGGRTATGISSAGKVAAKIRHHGKPAVVGYAPETNYVGVGGVPMRLSATEMEGDDSDEYVDDGAAGNRLHHRRTGSSGRSSTASARRMTAGSMSAMSMTGAGPAGAAGGNSPGQGLGYRSSPSRRYSPGNTPERSGSMVEDRFEALALDDERRSKKAPSTASGSSSGERADAVGELGMGMGPPTAGAGPTDQAPRGTAAASRLASNSLLNAALTREKSVKTVEELRRRGSVDERTMSLTVTGPGRLYIANPD